MGEEDAGFADCEAEAFVAVAGVVVATDLFLGEGIRDAAAALPAAAGRDDATGLEAGMSAASSVVFLLLVPPEKALPKLPKIWKRILSTI